MVVNGNKHTFAISLTELVKTRLKFVTHLDGNTAILDLDLFTGLRRRMGKKLD